MSLGTATVTPEVAPQTIGMPEADGDDFEAFSAKFDSLTSEVERDEAGRFKGKEDVTAKEDVAAALTEEKPTPVADEAEKPVAKALPANWTPDMADLLDGMAPEKASKLTAWSDKMHRQMSDLGREASTAKAFGEVAQRYSHYFQGDMTPAKGFADLMAAQVRLDNDPVEGIMWLADRYGVKDRLFSADGQPAQAPSNDIMSLRTTIAELRNQLAEIASPDAVTRQVNSVLESRTAEDLVNRFSKEKPFYAEVEAVLPDFIPLARKQAAQGSSNMDILERAYDMAVHADPALREKVRQAAKPAADVSAERAEKAKKAASINVSSVSSGKSAPLTEEQEMERVWAKLHA